MPRLNLAEGFKNQTELRFSSAMGEKFKATVEQYQNAQIMKKKLNILNEAKKEIGMVIESIDNIDIAYELAKKYDVEMPIVNTVYDVLYNGLEPKEAVTILMTRGKKSE